MNTKLSSDIVIWMNQPSHYQTSFFRELASRDGIHVHVFYGTGLPLGRKSLGWSNFMEEKYDQRVLSSVWDVVVEAWRYRRATHMINGLWSVPYFILATVVLLFTGARIYFHAEMPNPSTQRKGGWLGLKRLWIRVLFTRAAGLFAIGNGAVRFYRDMGVPRCKITPFMYFNHPSPVEVKCTRDNSRFVITYVGQFIQRKRVVDLIDAFGQWAGERSDVQLRLIGSGPLGKFYLERAMAHGLAGRIEVIGPLSPHDVGREIQRGHVLVLPSEFDGWGLTVNEALQVGIPVICSDGCGASEILIDNPRWGLVYPKGSISALAAALKKMASDYEEFTPLPSQVENRIGPKVLTDLFVATTMKVPFGSSGV